MQVHQLVVQLALVAAFLLGPAQLGGGESRTIPPAADEVATGAPLYDMLGYEVWWIRDSRVAGCPGNPDAWDVYIVWGYPNASANAGYTVTSRQYAGETAYQCDVYHDGDF